MPAKVWRRFAFVRADSSISAHIAVPKRAIDRETAAIIDERIHIRMDEMIDELISFSARLRIPHKAPRVRMHAGV